jgi:hypothetical protein
MHFPDTNLPPISPVTDRTEITPKTPISAALKVSPGFRENPSGGNARSTDFQEADLLPEAAQPEPAPYSGAERRAVCRRLFKRPVMLDTRSGAEQRQRDQIGEAPPTHMNEKA